MVQAYMGYVIQSLGETKCLQFLAVDQTYIDNKELNKGVLNILPGIPGATVGFRNGRNILNFGQFETKAEAIESLDEISIREHTDVSYDVATVRNNSFVCFLLHFFTYFL